MLQLSDENYIARVVMPFSFKLVNGRVLVDEPSGLMSELRDNNGVIVRKPQTSIFTQDYIEKRVDELKRLEKRSAMASNFTDQLLFLDDVLRQFRKRVGSDQIEDFANDPEIGPWLVWRNDLLNQCEKTTIKVEIKLLKWPKFPKGHRHNSGTRELAKRVGHDGPF